MRNKLFILLILFSAVARHYSHLSLKGRNSGMSGRMRPCRSFPVSLFVGAFVREDADTVLPSRPGGELCVLFRLCGRPSCVDKPQSLFFTECFQHVFGFQDRRDGVFSEKGNG